MIGEGFYGSCVNGGIELYRKVPEWCKHEPPQSKKSGHAIHPHPCDTYVIHQRKCTGLVKMTDL